MNFAIKFEGFSKHFLARCSANSKSLGNTDLHHRSSTVYVRKINLESEAVFAAIWSNIQPKIWPQKVNFRSKSNQIYIVCIQQKIKSQIKDVESNWPTNLIR